MTRSETGNLPGDFALRRKRGRILAIDTRLAEPLEAIGATDPDRLLAFPAGPVGRGATRRIAVPGAPHRALIVRLLRRGGLLGALLGPRLFGPDRPFDELRVHLRLLEAGAPVARPAFAMAWRQGPSWRAAYATWEEGDCVDGLTWLRAEPDPARLAAGLRGAGRALRAFHDCGGCHADLNASNLLVRDAAAGTHSDVIVIDLDRAWIAGARSQTEETGGSRGSSAARRAQELARLARSLRKHLPERELRPREQALFLRAYFGDDRDLRAGVRRHAAREALRSGVHALRYRGVR